MADDVTNTMQRRKVIERTSLIGILGNVLLSAFKAMIGFFTGSIAIVMDAVNNLSDALSSLITVIGIRLAVRPPDKDHPFGHGRTEYLSSLSIAALVLFAGATSMVESVKSIINPSKPDYTAVSLVIVGVAVAVKILLGLYFRHVGKNVRSDSLTNSGTDALMDAVISTMTLVAAAVFIIFNVAVEPYLAALISLLIIKSGIDMVRETLSRILGEGLEASLAARIKDDIKVVDPRIMGAYDLVIHDYGPGVKMGSVHIEIPDTMTINDIDILSRRIAERIYSIHHIAMTAVGVYSFNMEKGRTTEVREHIREKVMSFDESKEMHGFYMNDEDKEIRFDVVLKFTKDPAASMTTYNNIVEWTKNEYPDYAVYVGLDRNFSDR